MYYFYKQQSVLRKLLQFQINLPNTGHEHDTTDPALKFYLNLQSEAIREYFSCSKRQFLVQQMPYS